MMANEENMYIKARTGGEHGLSAWGGCCPHCISNPRSPKEWGLHRLNYLQVIDQASQCMTQGCCWVNIQKSTSKAKTYSQAPNEALNGRNTKSAAITLKRGNSKTLRYYEILSQQTGYFLWEEETSNEMSILMNSQNNNESIL